MNLLFVPVQSNSGFPLMPTTPARARRLMRNGRAYSFWLKGVFCIRLKDRAKVTVQEIAVGVDPGSKREAYTVKSSSHTYLNILSDAVTWVKDAVERKRNARRGRRYRNTPYRQDRQNRKRSNCLPPSTKARWQLKLNICKWLTKLFPVKTFVVEDVKAKTLPGKGNHWNLNFSPLAAGKRWFYDELERLGGVELLQGYETFELRNQHGLLKSKNKLSETFNAHCVDSWVLANSKVCGHSKPENESMLRIVPIQLHRRQLHRFQPSKGGVRSPYGSTSSLGLKRGSLVRHPKWGMSYVGGTWKNRVSLHDLNSGKRLTQSANTNQLTFLCFGSCRIGSVL